MTRAVRGWAGFGQPARQLRPWVGKVRRQFGAALFHQHAQRRGATISPFFSTRRVATRGSRSLCCVVVNARNRGRVRWDFGFQRLDLLVEFGSLLASARSAMFGVIGGVAAFGLVGLFIGPVILAMLVAIWREYLLESAQPVK